MSGPLVGLVIDHGPRDRSAYAVLVVIAERLHGPMRTYDATTADLAHMARVSEATAHRAVLALVADGWVDRTPGRWKGHASTYRIRLDAFPAEAVERALAKGVTVTASPVSTGSHHDSLSGPKAVTMTPKAVTTTEHSVSVQTSVGGAATVEATDDALPVVVGVRTGPDDRDTRRALETFAVVPSKTLTTELGRAFDRGQTPAAVNAHLVANVDVRNCRDVGAVLVRLVRELPAVAAPVEATGALCDECAERESVCRSRPYSGHTFTHDPVAMSAVLDAVLDDVERDADDRRHRMARATAQYDPFRRRGGRTA